MTEATSNKGEQVLNPSTPSNPVKRPLSTDSLGLPASGNTSKSALDIVTQAPGGKENEQDSSPSERSKFVKRTLPLSTEDPCTKTNDMPKKLRGTLLSVKKKEIGVGSQETHKTQTKKTRESST